VPQSDNGPVANGSAGDASPPAGPRSVHARHARPQAAATIGVIVADATTGLFADPYYLALLEGIMAALAERSLMLMLMAPMSPAELKATKALVARKDIGGVILVGLHTDSPLPALMQSLEIPAVTVGHTVRELSNVECDCRDGAMAAVEHLISLGRRRIAVISGDLDIPVAVDRLLGYREALAAAGIAMDPTMEEVADFLADRAHLSMERLLLSHPDLDAVFVASDQMAAAAVGVLTHARKRIPEDVAVIGFDDSRFALETSPALSTVRQPFEELGREAVHVLMRHVAEPHEAPRQVRLKTKLVVRASTVGREGTTAAGRPS
jgi:DNA-binding LacI/PurR family transcriptional regulator